MTGFEGYSTEDLLIIRANLMRGLTRVADSLADGTFLVSPDPDKGAASPSQSGCLTLMLYTNVSKVLTDRGAI